MERKVAFRRLFPLDVLFLLDRVALLRRDLMVTQLILSQIDGVIDASSEVRLRLSSPTKAQ